MWIHWRSPVASANMLIRSWSIECQELVPSFRSFDCSSSSSVSVVVIATSLYREQLAQRVPIGLADRGERQRREHVDLPRILVPAEALLAEGDELLRRAVAAFQERHERDHLFAVPWIRTAEDAGGAD